MTELNVPNAEQTGLTRSVDAAVENLRAALCGPLIGPDDPSYDEARTVWNAMIDRRPALIARCRRSADVRSALRFARDHGLPVAVRFGGHNIAGSARTELARLLRSCQGGHVADCRIVDAPSGGQVSNRPT